MSGASAGLYVHIPFCRTKCPYCAFDSAPAQEHLIDDYIDAVCEEIASRPRAFRSFDSVYFGGGTPGMLEPDHMGRLTDFIRSELFLTPDCESTVEVNPGDVNPETARFLVKQAGFNRISIGVQSFEQNELEFLGRRHDADDALNAVEDCMMTGARVGIDLIQGLPGQDAAARLKSVERAAATKAHHISVYELSIDEGSEFAARKKAGKWPEVPADASADGYLAVSTWLRKHGYVHYEVSNYSLGPSNLSRHNMRYWKSGSWLGVGAAAHSFDGRSRWWNVKTAATYIEAIKSGSAAAGREQLTDEQKRLERVVLGFRCIEGVAMEDLLIPNRDALIDRLVREKLVMTRDNRVYPTIEGFAVGDGLARVLSGP